MMDKEQSPQSQQPNCSDEIDIFRLCIDLWEKRAMIMVCILFVTMCGFGYIYLTPETFKSEVRLYPTKDTGLPKSVSLLMEPTAYENLPAGAFKLVQKHLTSPSTFLRLMDDSDITDILDNALPKLTDKEKVQVLLRKVKVQPPNHNRGKEFIMARLEWGNSIDVAKLANTWVASAVEGAEDELTKASTRILNRKIKEIDQVIELKKERARIQINNEISRLREAKSVVKQIGELDVAGSDSLLSVVPEYANIRSLRALYSVGNKAIDAEIGALESRRERADYYISGLFELEEQRAQLVSVPLHLDVISNGPVNARSIDKGRRVGSNYKLIVGLSLLFGLIFGLALALIKIGIDNRTVVK